MPLQFPDMPEPFHADAIGHNPYLCRVAAQLLLNDSILLKKRHHHVRRAVGKLGNIIKILNPHGLEITLCPAALDDFRLPLPRINAVLRNQKRLFLHAGCQAADNAAVPCCHAVIHIRLRQGLMEKIKQRQQHGAHGPEKIRKGQVAVPAPVHLADNIKKIAAHKNRQGAADFALVLENLRHSPYINELFPHDQVIDAVSLRLGQNILLQGGRPTAEDFIQKNLLNPRHICRKLVFILSPVLCLRPQGVDKELILRKALHQHLYPGRHAPHHIGIGAFHQQTYPHCCSPAHSTANSGCSTVST